MKKALLTLMCLAAMMVAGTSLKAQEVTIVLTPGWNWISHPSTDTVDFATAFGSFTPATGDVIKSRWGQAFYTNNRWMGSISQFYPGYGYMYKSNRTMPILVTFYAQQPTPQVVVTTSEPLLITAISAMGGGEVTVSNGTYILAKGLCWATHENPMTNDDFYQEAESGVGSFSLSMTGLNISTTYYVRAYAVTGNGTVYGDQKTFTTRDGIPTLTTDSVVDITGATATCGGNITDNGGLNVTARGVCWSVSPNPTVADSHTTNGSGNGSFSCSITGLSVSTTYYVRAYATTAAGTGYGEQVSFTTRDGIPTLTTTEVTNITGATATCGGNITDNGGLNVTVCGVCWSTSPNPTVADSHTTNDSGNGSFTSSITGLGVSTTYYVRAYATTNAGTGYGGEVCFTTRDGIPEVNTASITNIMVGGATCGGIVTEDGGLFVITRGVCWSINPEPTINDSYTVDGSGVGEFSSNIGGLTPNTTYYLRAYATNSHTTVYGNQQSFTTLSGGTYAYVDLGLPSGTLWATCNVGANVPEEYGDYFAWGETQPKEIYSWSTYQYCNGSYNTLTKYCYDSGYGYNGFTDNLTTLQPGDDAATVNWGADWRMPTKEELQELYNNTTVTELTQNGVKGSLFTASNGNSLFLPVDYYISEWWICRYWANSLFGDQMDGHPCYASMLGGILGGGVNVYMDGQDRCCGLSIRPVRSTVQGTSFMVNAIVNPTEGGEVIGGGAYQEGSECTFTAVANPGYIFTNWTENDEVVSSDAIYSFTVNSDRTLVANFTYDGSSTNDYVDLGLPSGTLWATSNEGGYFQLWDSPPNFGEGWRMPTGEEWWELLNHTTNTWTTQNGIGGRLFTASNGNTLFLPAEGFYQAETGSLESVGISGYYWCDFDCGDCFYWWPCAYFTSETCGTSSRRHYDGLSVRAVRTTH